MTRMLVALPIQSKRVVELHMWMSHGVKGRKLLQSLYQLYDGLIILEGKKRSAIELFLLSLVYLTSMTLL